MPLVANRTQTFVDLRFAAMRSVYWRFKLRAVRNLPSPCLPGSKVIRPWRHPKHHRTTSRVRADEKPLMPPEVTRAGHHMDFLAEVAKPDPEPPLVRACQIRREHFNAIAATANGVRDRSASDSRPTLETATRT